jgi:hypothetical protein
MKRNHPPAVATWLLKLLGQRNDHILGDLAEEYQAGRSAPWYWRQVIGAIVFGTVSDIRDHKVVTLRALAVGATSVWFVGNFVIFPLLGFDEWLFTRGLVKWFYLNGYGFPRWFGPLHAQAVMFALSGWIVGRTHRRYGISMVLAYAVFTACANSINLVRGTAVPHPFYPMTQLVLILFLLYPLSVLLGGLWGLSTDDTTRA